MPSITIRFSTSTPDLLLSTAEIRQYPALTTGSLKTLIRRQRPELERRQLRLIYAGKVLVDGELVSRQVRGWGNGSYEDSGKGKGKEREGEEIMPTSTIYIHCVPGAVVALGSRLEDEDLTETKETLSGKTVQGSTASVNDRPSSQLPISSVSAEPRGFDRLSSAGFSQSDVAQLRASFNALHAATHTPDTAPTAAEMRALEEAWLDNTGPLGSTNSTTSSSGLNNGTIATTPVDDAMTGEYEDLVIGTVLGFFWPLGAVVWLVREEGVWSARKRQAVLLGLCINVSFSLVRVYH